MIGVFLGNYGGDIKFQLGIRMIKYMLEWKHPKEEGWVQDDDVLDTWFSSALWPFSTLGWPDRY